MFNLMMKADEETPKELNEGFEQRYNTMPFDTLEILLSDRSSML